MNALSQLSTVAPTLARRFPPLQVLMGLLLAQGLAACSLMPQRGEPLPEDSLPVVRPAPSPRTDATTAILAAELAARRGSMDQAARYTLEAARITGDVALAERATKLAFAAEDESLAEEAAALWLELAPEDEAARNLRLRARISRGEATLEDLRQWLEQSSDGDLAETQLAGLLGAASPDADQALGLLTALEDERASAGLAYGLGVLALRYGEPDMALDALQRARERGWNARECDELSLRVQLAQGDLQAAAESLRALRGAPSGGRTEALALGQLLLDAEAWDLARTHFAWARTRWPEDPAAALALGLLEAQDGNDAAARTHFQDLWTQKTRPDEAAWQMARLEGRAGNWAEAERWFARVERGSRYFDAQLGLAHALSEQARLLEAQAVLAELRATQPMQAPRAWMAEAELLERRGMQAEALRLIDQAIAEEPTKDLYYKRALMHEQAGDIQAAEADLQWIIKRAPDDAQALNALGYMLADHGHDLERARLLIERALELRPEDPAVRDSLGWVLYRGGDTEAARGHLEAAYAQYPDPEIAAHLGEVLWVLGDKEGAMTVWREALRQAPSNPTLLSTWRRFLAE